jgi:hypothetical protein
MERFMWWKRRKLNPDEACILSAEFLYEFGITPDSVLNGGEVYVLLHSFIKRYGRIGKESS